MDKGFQRGDCGGFNHSTVVDLTTVCLNFKQVCGRFNHTFVNFMGWRRHFIRLAAVLGGVL